MDYDLAIVGAGPAGLVAARTATELGLSHCVLEAKHRIGGRAYTEHECFGVPVDHGCHWLEGAEANPFRAYADRLGIAYQRSHRNEYLFGSGVWCPAEDVAAFSDYADQVWAAGREAAAAGNDVALAQVAPPSSRWAGLFGGWCAALTGFEPERVSTVDLARYDERWGAWPVIDGYGALIGRYGAKVQVQTDCLVRRIDWAGGGVVLDTGNGSIKAKCALITVSTGVLAADRIRFEPQLPAWKRDAIGGIPMGPAAKVMVGVRAGFIDLPDSQYVRFDNGTSRTAGYQVRPYGRELVIANFAGSFAAELESQGRDAMIEFVLSQMDEMFGSDLRHAVTGADATAWCGDPHVLGGYSIARPGYANCRRLLGEPVGGRLFFAGEAVSLSAFGSAHGAYESAQNAVHTIQGCLGPGDPPA